MATFTLISKRADVSFIRNIDEADRAKIRKYLRDEVGVSARNSQRYVTNAFSEQVRNPPREIADAIYQKWLEIELQKRDPFLDSKEEIAQAYPDLGRGVLKAWTANPAPDCGERPVLGVENHLAGEVTDIDDAYTLFGALVDGAEAERDEEHDGGTQGIEMRYLVPGKYQRATWGNSGRMKEAQTEIDEFTSPVFIITIDVLVCGSDRQTLKLKDNRKRTRPKSGEQGYRPRPYKPRPKKRR